GRWYDRAGGRAPLAVGFIVLAISGVLLAMGVRSHDYWLLFPGFFVYGIGLALILTVNDPVSLDTVPDNDQGQASGVAATAEQFGGAVGIAGLYLILRDTYLRGLKSDIASGPLPQMTAEQARRFKNAMMAAENSGLQPKSFGHGLEQYLLPARSASENGYSAAFLAVAAACLVGLFLMFRLVRKPPTQSDGAVDAAEAAA